MRTAAPARAPKRHPAQFGLAHYTLVDTPLGRGRTLKQRVKHRSIYYLVQFLGTYNPQGKYRPGSSHWLPYHDVTPLQESHMRIVVDDALLASAPSFNSVSGPVIKLDELGNSLSHDVSNHPAIYLPRHGLIFTAQPINDQPETQTTLEAACGACRTLGCGDWSMPEIEELELLIDRRHDSPATNTDLLRLPSSGRIWSKTDAEWSRDAAGVASAAWGVFASGGGVDYGGRGSRGFALAVRRVGQ